MVKPLFNAPFPNLKYVHVYNNPNYCDPPCEELVKWADKKNFKGKWWQIKITSENIWEFLRFVHYSMLFIIACWLFIPFIVGLVNILGKYLSWKLSKYLGLYII
jgi:hypothetical protein